MLDMETYQTYKCKDYEARILMLSSMRNDIMLHFERHRSIQAAWDAIKIQYGETSTTRLRQLILKFDGYKKHQNQTMRQYFIIMSNLINELRGAKHEMTDEQQVQVVIHSLPSNWEHIRVNLTHNDNIKIFDDVARHVELEEDRLLAEKPINKAFISETKMQGSYGSKHKKGKCKSPKYGKGGIEVNSNINANMENMVVKKTRI